MLDTTIADDAGAYVGFTVGSQPAESPWAVAKLPVATESTTVLGCTPELEAGVGFLGQELALNATHIYAILWSSSATESFRIVRAAR